MLKIELVPDINRCIEMVAKREYAQIVGQLLASGEHNPKLFEIVRLLMDFLEIADFKKLRVESEKHLVEGKNVKFVVYTESGVSKCDLQIFP